MKKLGRPRHTRKESIFYFFGKVNKSGSCWNWEGGKNHAGYGNFQERFSSGKPKQWGAHRFSFYISNGDIPVGMCVLHSCDNPSCVNPEHLFLGNSRDNIIDCLKKRRAKYGEKSHLSRFTDFEASQIREEYKNLPLSSTGIKKAYGGVREMALKYKTTKHCVVRIGKGHSRKYD